MADSRQSNHCFRSIVGTGSRSQHLELPDKMIFRTSASVAGANASIVFCMTAPEASSTIISGKDSVMILIFSEKKETKLFASTLGSLCLGNFVTGFIHRVCDLERGFWIVNVLLNLSLIVCRFGCPTNTIHILASILVYIQMYCQFR